MKEVEVIDLCEAAGLNVRAVTQTVNHFIAQVARDKRSSQSVIARLRKLAAERGLPLGAVTFAEAPVGDTEYWFGVRP